MKLVKGTLWDVVISAKIDDKSFVCDLSNMVMQDISKRVADEIWAKNREALIGGVSIKQDLKKLVEERLKYIIDENISY